MLASIASYLISELKGKSVRVMKSGAGFLFLATLFTQSGAVVVIPILTKIYNAESFGIWATVLGIAAPVSILATLRLELALPLQRSHKDESRIISALSFTYAIYLFFSGIICLVVYLVAYTYFVIALYVFAIGFFLACQAMITQYLAGRELFKNLAVLNVSIFVLNTCFQLFFAFAEIGNPKYGLLNGTISSSLLACIYSMLVVHKNRDRNEKVKYAAALTVVKENWNFVKYSASGEILYAVSRGWPAALITYFYGLEMAGIYAVAQKVLDSFVRLMEGSIRPVMYTKIAKIENRSVRRRYIRKTAIRLLIVCAVVAISIISFGNPIVNILLGHSWSDVYIIVCFLLPWIFSVVVTLPYKCELLAYGQQSVLFFLTMFLLIARLSSFIAIALLHIPHGLYISLLVNSLLGVVALLYLASPGMLGLTSLSKRFFPWRG